MHYKYVSHVLATWQNIIVLIVWKCIFKFILWELIFKVFFKVYFCYLVKHHCLPALSAALEHHKLHIGWEGSNPEMGSNCIGLVHQTGLDWNEILISLLPQSTCKTFQDCVHLDVLYCYLEVISLILMIVKKNIHAM